MSKRKILKVDAEVFNSSRTALNIYINELEAAASVIESATGPSDKTREMLADVEVLYHILDGLTCSEECVDQDPPGILESAKRPSQLN